MAVKLKIHKQENLYQAIQGEYTYMEKFWPTYLLIAFLTIYIFDFLRILSYSHTFSRLLCRPGLDHCLWLLLLSSSSSRCEVPRSWWYYTEACPGAWLLSCAQLLWTWNSQVRFQYFHWIKCLQLTKVTTAIWTCQVLFHLQVLW